MSGVNDDCYVHYYIQQLNRLGDILVYICSGVETMADWWQLTQGGSKVKRYCQSTTGGAWICVTSHWQESENGLIWERGNDFSK